MKLFKTLQRFFFRDTALSIVLPTLLWQFYFFIVPLTFIVVMSFMRQWEMGPLFGFSLFHYKELFTNTVYFKIIGKSLLLATWTASICLVVGYPLACYIAFIADRAKNFLLFLLIVPFWTNFLVQVYAWFFILEKEGFLNDFLLSLGIISKPFLILNSFFAVSLVMFYCYLPFMVLPIYSVLDKFDRSLIDASSDLGATFFQTLTKVIIPLSLSGVKTGFFLVFVPAFSEFVIPMLVGGDKFMYTGGLISYYFLSAQNASMGAAITVVSSIVLFFVVLVCSWYVWFLMQPKRKG